MQKYHLGSEFNNAKSLFKAIVGRDEYLLVSDSQIREYYIGKKILIVGAGGTIGSAVARKLVLAGVSDVYFLDRDESALHALALSVSDSAASHSDKCIVADIKDQLGIRLVIQKYKPEVIIHAAALKHLVVLERFQREGYLTNVVGTYNLLLAASELGATQFINVSTDKAANPTSLLGKTKKITELLTHSFNDKNQMKACSVRFGNVFASRGSVIETFVHQIENNLPVTLTDALVTRYFMSHDEAASLILTAGIMATNGVLVQNMGSEVMLTNVIAKLSEYLGKGYILNIIGLQPGEKLQEELYADLFTSTKIDEIVRVEVKSHPNLPERIELYKNPLSDREALEFVENLITS